MERVDRSGCQNHGRAEYLVRQFRMMYSGHIVCPDFFFRRWYRCHEPSVSSVSLIVVLKISLLMSVNLNQSLQKHPNKKNISTISTTVMSTFQSAQQVRVRRSYHQVLPQTCCENVRLRGLL